MFDDEVLVEVSRRGKRQDCIGSGSEKEGAEVVRRRDIGATFSEGKDRQATKVV